MKETDISSPCLSMPYGYNPSLPNPQSLVLYLSGFMCRVNQELSVVCLPNNALPNGSAPLSLL